MNYFEFMELPVSFKIDEGVLRKKYYQHSRHFHPDYFSLADEDKRAWALEQSTLNNAAYSTLSDPDKRMEYILQIKGLAGDESKATALPQDFLMEMMDINEAIMELQFDFDAQKYQQALDMATNMEFELFQEIKNILETYVDNDQNEQDLEKVKYFFLKKKYLLRIKENLSTFAPA